MIRSQIVQVERDGRGQYQQIDVSFCLPVYNVEAYVEDCIASIIKQHSEHYLYEIVCVDDCSTDRSCNIIEKLANRYPQIRVFKNNTNLGVSATRNRALKEARGRYIWYVDPDDMLPHDVVYAFIRCATETKAEVIRGNYLSVPESANWSDYLPQVIQPFQDRPFSEAYAAISLVQWYEVK